MSVSVERRKNKQTPTRPQWFPPALLDRLKSERGDHFPGADHWNRYF